MNETVEVVSDAQMWALIVGFVSPLLIALIQQPQWSNQIRVAVTVLWSALAGAGTALFTGEFSGRGVLSCFLVVCVSAIAAYQNLWRPTKIASLIEAKTSRDGKARVITTAGNAEQVVVDRPGQHRAT